MDGEEGGRKKEEGKWGWGGGSVGKGLLPEPEGLSVGPQHSCKKLSGCWGGETGRSLDSVAKQPRQISELHAQ